MMKFYNFTLYFCILLLLSKFMIANNKNINNNMFKLPQFKLKGNISIEEAIDRRRSIRDYLDQPLKIEDVSQLLWAGQGISDPTNKFRTAPSAGALYPIKLYICVGNVSNLPNGLYYYQNSNHSIIMLTNIDIRKNIWEVSLWQNSIIKAPIVIIITAIFDITKRKYGERASQYVYIEAGHIAQNILLQAYALGLGGVPIGAFYDDGIKNVLKIPKDETPIYIIPIGKKK